MLRWAIDNKGEGFVFTLITRTDTTLSGPFRQLVNEAEAAGIVFDHVRRTP